MAKGQIKSKPLHLFSDEPTESDQFGSHDAIAQTLLDIITTDGNEDYHIKKPFVVGLYGKWGSGKSSIIKMLENKINNIHELRIAMVDAWSVGPKNFPRHVILAAAEKYFSEDEEYFKREILPSIVTLTREEKTNWEVKEGFKNALWKSVQYTVSVYLILIGINYFNDLFNLNFPFGTLIYAIVPLYIAFLTSYLFPKYKQKKNIEIKDILFEDPTYFRQELKRIREESIKKFKNRKQLCIIVDNLDRLSSSESLQILGTIKTFISDGEEFSDISFIIPCDPEQIVAEINLNSNIRKEDIEKTRNEALRKYFNTTLTIPPPIWNDLESFARSLLEKSNLNLEKNDLLEISSSLSLVYGDNPRQIKKFINNLIAENRHAEILENEGQINPKITDKMPLFSFFLILQNELRGEKVPQTIEKLTEFSEQPPDKDKGSRIQDFVKSRSRLLKKVTEEEWSRLFYFKNPGAERKYKDLLYTARIGDIESFLNNYEDLDVDDVELISYLSSAIKSESEIINLIKVLLNGIRKGLILPIITTINNQILPLLIKDDNYWLDLHPKALYSHLIMDEPAIVNKIISRLNEGILNSGGELQEEQISEMKKWARRFITTIIMDSARKEKHLEGIEALIAVSPSDLSIVVLENPTLNWNNDSVTYAIEKWRTERLVDFNEKLYHLFVNENISYNRPPALLGIVIENLSTMLDE